MNSQRQAARKFREYWTLANESEVGGYQKFWISILGDVLGVENAMDRISFQAPVPMKGTTKYLDAWIPETRVLIEHKSRGIKLEAPQSGHGGKTPFEQALREIGFPILRRGCRVVSKRRFLEALERDACKILAGPTD